MLFGPRYWTQNMNFQKLFDWPTTKAEAYGYQSETVRRVEIRSSAEKPRLIAAVDTDYGVGGETLYAAVAVLTFPELVEVERTFHSEKVVFPYIPGLFYYREGPVIVGALSKARSAVDLVMVSGHGTAHPKLCGIACHVGIDFGVTAIGCSRRLLAGEHEPVGDLNGSFAPIMLSGKEVGLAYRSKDGVKPIFISPGHRCDLAYARDITVACLRGYRLPEPLRIAHLLANKSRQRAERHAAGSSPANREESE